MKLSELFARKKVVLSFEVFPPKKGGPIDSIYSTLEALCPLKPDFISVTYGAGGNEADHSTCDIASLIKRRYGIEPLAHLTCVNSTRAQIDGVLTRLKGERIENVLALRGDMNPDFPPRMDFRHAEDLIRAVRQSGGFDIAAACYPEGHPECESLEQDIEFVRRKADAGASFLISQLFFDNGDFYRFRELARIKGIGVPVTAGIMPVVNKRQIERMVSLCGASLPKPFVKIMNRYGGDPIALRDAGISYATRQIIDLLANSVQGIHLYTMNNPDVARRIMEGISSVLDCENRDA